MINIIKMEPWFVAGDIGQTIKNLIDQADVVDFKFIHATDKEIFVDELYKELRFLGPYTKEEFNDVISYLYDHLDELYIYYQGKDK